jgi:hypothetical protein
VNDYGFSAPFYCAAAGPWISVLRRTSKMTAVDQPNTSMPFIAVIGPISRHCSVATTSPYASVV